MARSHWRSGGRPAWRYGARSGSRVLLAGEPISEVVLHVFGGRTFIEPLSLETEARRIVASMDGNIPVTDVRTMQDRIGLELAQPRFAMVLLSAFAGMALILTLVGLYG